MEYASLTGCGTQHPHRALGGTRVLLAAAPTTPPCFRRWRRSSSLHFAHNQQNRYFKFRSSGTPASVPLLLFHRRGRDGKRQVQRRFLRKRGAADIPGNRHTKQKSHRFCISASTMASYWSGRRGSNSLPPPWQGGALPDELRPHIRCIYPCTLPSDSCEFRGPRKSLRSKVLWGKGENLVFITEVLLARLPDE